MKVDKLCLGTVQIGLKYGIKNDIGRQPTQEESFSLLKQAIDSGIDTFDTASVYGNAEQILGDFGIGKYDVKVISKLSMSDVKNNFEDIQDIIEKKIYTSLEKMELPSLHGYLLHNASDFYNQDIMKGLQRAKDKGIVKNIGVSIYEESDALAAVNSGMIDYIQIPYNVFDQRLDQTQFFSIAQKNNIKVFARSAFLQGLLLMDINQVPENLEKTKKYLQSFDDIVSEYGFTRKEAAFLFSYSHSYIDKIVFGVETIQQLNENLSILEKINSFAPCHIILNDHFINMEKNILLPNLWNK